MLKYCFHQKRNSFNFQPNRFNHIIKMASDANSKFKRDNYERLRDLAFKSTIPFPKNKLQAGTGKGPRVVVVACGSYSPITYMHLRMFEQAKDFATQNGVNLVGGYFSPVTDAYNKKGLVKATHRVKMAELALESNDWVMVDSWESQQPEYQTTLVVLDHFKHELNKDLKPSDEPIQVRLLCGGDLLDSFNAPGVWAPEDIKDIISNYGLVVLERAGSDASSIVYNNDTLFPNSAKIQIIKQWISNDISSTKIRQNIARGLSIKYLTPDNVVKYIQENHLYKL